MNNADAIALVVVALCVVALMLIYRRR